MKTSEDITKYSLAAGYQDLKEKLTCDFSLVSFFHFSYLNYNILMTYLVCFTILTSQILAAELKNSSENFQKACRANFQYSHWYTGNKPPWTACKDLFIRPTGPASIIRIRKFSPCLSEKKSFLKRCFTFFPGVKR